MIMSVGFVDDVSGIISAIVDFPFKMSNSNLKELLKE